MPNLTIAQDPAADDLLGRDPLALLIGMLLDQQFPMERAFSAPRLLADRLGVDALSAEQLADADADELVRVFQGPPALHRYPGSMAARTQDLCRLLVERYDGRPEGLWADAPDGATLLKRLGELPGFGAQKSKIFLALLGKQYGVTPPGWREAAGDYGLEGSRRSVADITGPESLAEVRAFKQEQKQAAKNSRLRGRREVAGGMRIGTPVARWDVRRAVPGGSPEQPVVEGWSPWPRASSSRVSAGPSPSSSPRRRSASPSSTPPGRSATRSRWPSAASASSWPPSSTRRSG